MRYGAPRASTIEPAAMDALNAACRVLRAYHDRSGTHGIDVMQNGRFARNVVERAERLRDSRVAAQHRTDRGSVTWRTRDDPDPGHGGCGARRLRREARSVEI